MSKPREKKKVTRVRSRPAPVSKPKSSFVSNFYETPEGRPFSGLKNLTPAPILGTTKQIFTRRNFGNLVEVPPLNVPAGVSAPAPLSGLRGQTPPQAMRAYYSRK